MRLILHGYWRSAPSWRVRLALELKGLAYEQAPVNLLKGEQASDAHLARNPQGRIPVLEADGRLLRQSPAILEWLEETFPTPALLPADAWARAQVRALCALIACDVTPLQNLAVGRALERRFDADAEAVTSWRAHWNAEGLAAVEALVGPEGAGPYAFGAQPTLADIHVVTQLYGARRFGVDVERFPKLLRVERACAALPAFQAAAPERQPDAPADAR